MLNEAWSEKWSRSEICAFKGQTLRIECKLVQDNRPEVGKAFAELKKEGAIVSPVRCKWEPAK